MSTLEERHRIAIERWEGGDHSAATAMERAQVAREMGMRDEAVAFYEKAYRVDPGLDAAYAALKELLLDVEWERKRLAAPVRPERYAADMAASLAYPFRGATLAYTLFVAAILFAGTAALHAPLPPTLVGVPIAFWAFASGYLLLFADNVLAVAVQGEGRPPSWGDVHHGGEIFGAIFRYIGLLAVHLAAGLLMQGIGGAAGVRPLVIAGWVLLALGLALLPMSLLRAEVLSAYREGVNLAATIRDIARAPAGYLVLVVMLLPAIAVAAATVAVAGLLPWPVWAAASSLVWAWTLIALFRATGTFYRYNIKRLAWFE